MNSTRIQMSSDKLMLLITVVNRNKADFFEDFIQSLGANMQFVTFGEGTADPSLQKLLPITDSEKALIFSVIREEKQDRILQAIREKFESIRHGKGIAYTVPFSSVIGASVYHFLADNRTIFK